VSLNFEPWRKIMLLEAALHFADIAGSAWPDEVVKKSPKMWPAKFFVKINVVSS
jgi:hypothetical protein